MTALEGDLPLVASVLSDNPARILGRTARLVVGELADIVVVDTRATGACPAPQLSRSSNEPLAGRVLLGAVVATLVDGRVAWEA